MLELANVEVVYNEVILVLRGLSIEVPDGQIVALLGANGAGKTTSLRAISGLLGPHEGVITKGSITYDGKKLNDPQGPQDRRPGLSGRHHRPGRDATTRRRHDDAPRPYRVAHHRR